jgi:spore germination protein GerM
VRSKLALAIGAISSRLSQIRLGNWFSFTNMVGLVILLLGLAGLWASQTRTGTRTLNIPASLDSGPKTLKLHFAGKNGEGQIETRQILLEDGQDIFVRAVEELIKGPQQQGAAPVVPPGTLAPNIFLQETTALVDLPAAYTKLGYATAAESSLVYGIVNTLLEFKQVESVRFLLDGKEIESLGHISLVDPFKRQ